MDILKMLADLRQERAQIEEAITVLERLALGSGKKRRGRPRGSKNKPKEAAAQR
jgi:hypothetical protein